MSAPIEERVDEQLGEPCLGGMALCIPLMLMNLSNEGGSKDVAVDTLTHQLFLTHPSLQLLKASVTIRDLLQRLFAFHSSEERRLSIEEIHAKNRCFIVQTFAELNPSLGM